MKKDFNNNLPIYSQLMDKIKVCILSGKYPPGQKLPSVRDLAVEYGVNPNTMQKSLTKLEDQGLMYTERTSGRFVTDNQSLVDNLKNDIPKEIIKTFVADMEEVGIQRNEITAKVSTFLAEYKQGE